MQGGTGPPEAQDLVKPRTVQEAVQLDRGELALLFRSFLGHLSPAQYQRLQLLDCVDFFRRDEFEESANQGLQGSAFRVESVPLAQPRRHLFRF